MQPASKNEIREAAFVSIVLLVLLQVLLFISHADSNSILRDPDAYSWLNRVMLLHNGGDWFNFSNPRINPPVGLEQHWSHLFDLILYSGAWIGSHFLPFETALFDWAVILSPFLQIISLLSLFWALRPVMKDIDYLILGLLFITQMGILSIYGIGRPDHQLLLNLLFIISIGMTTRLLLYPFQWQYCIGAGLISALGMWVSVEILIVVLVNFLCLGGFWLLGREEFTRKTLHYTSSLVIFSLLFHLVENGVHEFSIPLLDKISIAFVLLFIFILIFWGIVYFVETYTAVKINIRARLIWALSGSVIIVLIMEILFPGFFAGPAAGVDELYNQTRRHNISEALPLVDTGKFLHGGWEVQSIRFISWMGILVPALPVMLIKLKKESEPQLRFWVLLAVSFLIFIPYTFLQIRWNHYAVIILLPPYAWLISYIIRSLETSLAGWKLSTLRILVILLSATVFILPGAFMKQDTTEPDNILSAEGAVCSLTKLANVLNNYNEIGGRPRNIITFVDYGPELLFRTKHSVYSIPNHRYQSGYSDVYNIMSAEKDDQAFEIIKKRRPDLLLICPENLKDKYYAREDGKETLYQRLVSGNTPQWLSQVSIPEKDSGNFKIYYVQYMPEKDKQ